MNTAAEKLVSTRMSAKTAKKRPKASKRRQPRGQGAAYVYERLRDMILRLELAPGSKIDESSIVDQLAVSRTPFREALVRLCSEKLVVSLPNRGAQVAPLDVMELAQYFEALELSHRAVQHWAALRRTDADLKKIHEAMASYESATISKDAINMSNANMVFHTNIAHASKNTFYEEMTRQLSAHGMRLSWIWFRGLSSDDYSNDIRRTVDEHRQIFGAIEKREVESAERLATQHVEAFRERLYARLNQTMETSVKVAAR